MKIEIYGKKWCSYGYKAKQSCRREKLDFLYKDLNKDFTREEIVEQFPGAKTSPLLLGRKICCSQGYFTTHWKGFLGTQNAFSAP
jgi:Glutaredoxin and related proteins